MIIRARKWLSGSFVFASVLSDTPIVGRIHLCWRWFTRERLGIVRFHVGAVRRA